MERQGRRKSNLLSDACSLGRHEQGKISQAFILERKLRSYNNSCRGVIGKLLYF